MNVAGSHFLGGSFDEAESYNFISYELLEVVQYSTHSPPSGDREVAEAERVQLGEASMLTPEQKDRLAEVTNRFKAFINGELLETKSLISHKIEFEESFQNAPPFRLNP